jgi:hypothetical protein
MEQIDPLTVSLVLAAIGAVLLIAAVVLKRRLVPTALRGKTARSLFHASGKNAFREERAARRREQRAEQHRNGR